MAEVLTIHDVVVTTAAAIALAVSVTTASTTTKTSTATTLIASSLMAVLHITLIVAALVLASWILLREFWLITICIRDHTSAGLLSQMIWDWIVDLSELSVSVSILTILVPLAVSLIFKVATFLSFESLIDLTLLELWLLAWHTSHASHTSHALHASDRLLRHLLLHLLLLNVLVLNRHGHLLLRLLLLGITNHLLLAWVCLHWHGHLRSAHGLRHRCLKLLLHLVLHFLLVLLLRLLLLLLRIGLSLHYAFV